MTDMVRVVAKAIAKSRGEFPTDCMDEARAAIAAMRTPTEAMAEIGRVIMCADDLDPTPEEIRRAYTAMIDAALSQPPREV